MGGGKYAPVVHLRGDCEQPARFPPPARTDYSDYDGSVSVPLASHRNR